eukprot:m.37094 g.37094  ORF g.37094 m.37094 type:complete len:730 (+) comp32320_c0_seq2:140-2329(+)
MSSFTPKERYGHESARNGDFFYVFGGLSAHEEYFPRNEIHIWDIRNQTWDFRVARCQNIPPPCREARSVVVDKMIYSFGGISIDNKIIESVYCLDPEAMEWDFVDVSAGANPQGREGCCFCAVGSRIIMFGGNYIDSGLYELQLSGKTTGVWVEIEASGAVPQPRCFAAIAEIDENRALIHGGSDGRRFYSDFCVIDLEHKKWTKVDFDHKPSARKGHTLIQLKGEELGTNTCFLLAGGRLKKEKDDHYYILNFRERNAYKMDWSEAKAHCTSLYVERPDGTADVMIFGGWDSARGSGKLNSIIKTLHLGPSWPEYVRVVKDISFDTALQWLPKPQQEQAKDERINTLKEQNAEIAEGYRRLEETVADLSKKNETMKKTAFNFGMRMKEREAEKKAFTGSIFLLIIKSLFFRKKFTDRCERFQQLYSKSAETIQKFREVLLIDPSQIYLTRQKLGKGLFGDVYVGQWLGVAVAVKEFQNLTTSKIHLQILQNEILISSQLHHPNILAVCGATFQVGATQMIVFELLEGSVGELIAAAKASGSYLTVSEQLSIVREIASVVAYLHQLLPVPYVHNGICPNNILVARDMKVKVGGLGSAHSLESSPLHCRVNQPYAAPERIRREGTAPCSSLRADVYSLGVTMIEVFTGIGPIAKEKKSQLEALRDRRALYRVCSKLIDENPENRLSAYKCLVSIEKEVHARFGDLDPPLKRLVFGKFVGENHKILLKRIV